MRKYPSTAAMARILFFRIFGKKYMWAVPKTGRTVHMTRDVVFTKDPTFSLCSRTVTPVSAGDAPSVRICKQCITADVRLETAEIKALADE